MNGQALDVHGSGAASAGTAVAPRSTSTGVLLWLLYLPALLVALLYFWAFLDHSSSIVGFPYQVDYGEAPELNRAVRLARGEPVYVDWSHPPFQMANYPPLYSAVAAIGVRLFGVQFFTGRLVSLLSTLGTGVLVGAVAWVLGAGARGALIGGLLYFVTFPVWNWGAFQRVDAFAVFLELGGVLVFAAGWIRRRRVSAVWATVPLFLAAAYSRQTVAAGALACYLYLLCLRPKLALAVSGVYVAVGLVLFGALHLATDGQFWRHVVLGNLNRWSWETVEEYWRPFWQLLHWMVALGAVGALLVAARRQAQMPLLYALASLATALTIGKIGSSFNYLLQLCAALSLLCGLAIGQLDWLMRRLAGVDLSVDVSAGVSVSARERLPRWLRPLPALALLGGLVPAIWLLIGLQQAYHVPYTVGAAGEAELQRQPAPILDRLRWLRWPLWRLDPWAGPPGQRQIYWRRWYRAGPGPLDGERARLAGAFVEAHPGEVLSEDMSFTVSIERRLYLQPFEFTQLAEQGQWDDSGLLGDVDAQRFGVVVLRFRVDGDPTWHAQRLGRPLREAIARRYRLAATYGDYFLYLPA